jgi:adenylate cyclase
MMQEGFKRKLTAILSADVAGYSRLMGEDEAATVKILSAYREVMAALVKQHRGRVVDSPGDNVLAEFASVVDAVQCAVAVQKELQERNAKLPENRKMEFRIGINLGDVIEEGDRIYGDGVNIAARLEALADPGGICISKTAFDQIETKLPLGYEYLGQQTVKNIAKPVGAYRVLMEPRITVVEERKKGKALRTRPRNMLLTGAIALLVFAVVVAIWNFYIDRTPPAIKLAPVERSAFVPPEKPSVAEVPPEGAVIAEAEFPSVGTKYTYKIVTKENSYKRTFVVIEDGMFEDREVHRVAVLGRNATRIYDKGSKNWMGSIFDGEIVKRAKPHEDLFRFPLYVGKKYKSKYSYSEKDWNGDFTRTVEVKSLEEVTVPAGTFEVLKIMAIRKGVKNIYWYSPKLRLYVKIIKKHRSAGESKIELIQYTKP